MSQKIKKILMVIAFLIVVGILAFLIWLMFFKQDKQIETEEPINTGTNQGGEDIVKLPSSSYGTGINGTTVIIDDNTTTNVEDLTNLTLEEILSKYREQDLKNVNEIPNSIVSKNTQLEAETSEVANGGTTRVNIISTSKNVSPVISGSNLISFNPDDGIFYKTDLDTNKKTILTDDTFKGASNIIWAPTTDVAVIEFPDGTNVSYDFNKNRQYVLPKNWYEFSFQKDGEKLAFMIDDKIYENRWLAISNIDGSGLTGIEPLGNNADKVDVMYSPNEQMVALSRTGQPIGMFQQSVLLIGLNGENFNDLKVEGRSFNPIWSPVGDKIVYDAYNSETKYKPNIWVVNATSDKAGTGSRSLNLSTWVSKCSFSSDGSSLYCAVPKDMPEGAGMFPEMMEEADIYDDIYVVNIYTGYKKLIAKPAVDIIISKVFLNDDNSVLYYQGASGGNIYSIKLK